MKIKTCKEWLVELPNPYQDQAIKNCTAPDLTVENLPQALVFAFTWDQSPEGYHYWRNVYNICSMRESYAKGFQDALESYSYMKDGVFYVGTCGTTLKEAKEKMKNSYKFNPPTF